MDKNWVIEQYFDHQTISGIFVPTAGFYFYLCTNYCRIPLSIKGTPPPPHKTHTQLLWAVQLTRRDDVEEVFKFIHPHFGQTPVVFVDDLPRSSRKRVGCCLSEHVTHMRAGDDLQGPPTLPDLQREEEKSLVNTESKTPRGRRHTWRPDGWMSKRLPADSCVVTAWKSLMKSQSSKMTPDKSISQDNNLVSLEVLHLRGCVCVCTFVEASRYSWPPATARKIRVTPIGCVHSLWKRFPGSLHPRCPCLRHKCRSPGNNLCL